MKFCSSTILILALGASADATNIRGVDLGRGLKSGNGKSNAERDMKNGWKNGKEGGKGKGSQAVRTVCAFENGFQRRRKYHPGLTFTFGRVLQPQ
jgi:hypothetical protein